MYVHLIDKSAPLKSAFFSYDVSVQSNALPISLSPIGGSALSGLHHILELQEGLVCLLCLRAIETSQVVLAFLREDRGEGPVDVEGLVCRHRSDHVADGSVDGRVVLQCCHSLSVHTANCFDMSHDALLQS